jgi:hypothetical protein
MPVSVPVNGGGRELNSQRQIKIYVFKQLEIVVHKMELTMLRHRAMLLARVRRWDFAYLNIIQTNDSPRAQ